MSPLTQRRLRCCWTEPHSSGGAERSRSLLVFSFVVLKVQSGRVEWELKFPVRVVDISNSSFSIVFASYIVKRYRLFHKTALPSWRVNHFIE